MHGVAAEESFLHLAQRLKCSACGGVRVGIMAASWDRARDLPRRDRAAARAVVGPRQPPPICRLPSARLTNLPLVVLPGKGRSPLPCATAARRNRCPFSRVGRGRAAAWKPSRSRRAGRHLHGVRPQRPRLGRLFFPLAATVPIHRAELRFEALQAEIIFRARTVLGNAANRRPD